MLRPRIDKLTQDELMNQLRLASLLPAASTMPCLPPKSPELLGTSSVLQHSALPAPRGHCTPSFAGRSLGTHLAAQGQPPRWNLASGPKTFLTTVDLQKQSLASMEKFRVLGYVQFF